MNSHPTGHGRTRLAGVLQTLTLAAVVILLAGCASSKRSTSPIEAPPLIIEVPRAAGAASDAGNTEATPRVTTVATLEELVAVVEPGQVAAATASPGRNDGVVTGPARTGSPLVPAKLVERGEVPLPVQAGASAANAGTAGAGSASASAASQAASATPGNQATAPADRSQGAAIGPLVAPPLPGDQANQLPTAANAVGGPTDTVEPQAPVSTEDAQAHTDLWDRVRDNFAMPDMDGKLVRNHEQWYRSRPDYVQRMTERGSRYLYHIVEEVTRRGMPSELALLPFIESAFNPQAISSAKASGMWQFIPSTGRNFDLKQNVFRDDRRDVLASTRAALDYLSKLHGMFGDWRLALAAYNWGEGNVGRAIARNKRARKSTRYEDLRMPAETRNYLPKLQAVKNIVADPEKFGLTLPELRNHPYFLSVPIYRDIDVDLAAELALLDVEEFRTLNPSMDKPVILAAGTPQVLLPYDNADEFVRNLAAYTGPLASWTAWQVTRTLKPADAAKLIGVSEDKLRSVNHIPQRMLIKSGSVLLVPRDDDHQGDVSEHMAEHAQMVLQPDGPLLRRVVYRTGRADTVTSVARRYRVAPSLLAQWNKVTTSTQFSAGQQVVVYVPSVTTKVARGGTRNRGAHAAKAGVRGKAATRSTGKSSVKAAGAKRAGPRAAAPRTASTNPPAAR